MLIFVCIRNLQGFVRKTVQLREIVFLMMRTEICFMDGQNLRGYIIFRCLVFIGFVSAII